MRKNYDERQKSFIRSCTMALLLMMVTVAIPVTAAETSLKKVSLIPLWSPQAQFAGYYMAAEKGIYARHGIDVTIMNGGPGHSASEYLLGGKADFAVLWLATALQHQSAGRRLVNVAQIIQRSSMMLVARKTSGISTPESMQGRKVGVWPGDLALPVQAFFTKYHLNVRIIPQSYTVNLFLCGGIDVASAMWYNEYHTIIDSGVNSDELELFFFKDHGITFPEDGLYTLEKNYRNDPAGAAAFTDASLEGWQYAFDHPDEAVMVVLRHMKTEHIPANRAHQKWMLDRMHDLILPPVGNKKMGQLNPSDFKSVGAELHRQGLIKTIPGFDDFTGRSDASK